MMKNNKLAVAILSLVLGVMLCVGAVFAVSIWYKNTQQTGNEITIGAVQEVAVTGTALDKDGVYPGATFEHVVTVNLDGAKEGSTYNLVFEEVDGTTATLSYWTVNDVTLADEAVIIENVTAGAKTLTFAFDENAPETEAEKVIKFSIKLVEVPAQA